MPERTPSDMFDEKLQQLIHEYRRGRAHYVELLQRSNWGNANAAQKLAELNLQIDTMTRMRDMKWWHRREPTLEEIDARSKAWYWEKEEE